MSGLGTFGAVEGGSDRWVASEKTFPDVVDANSESSAYSITGLKSASGITVLGGPSFADIRSVLEKGITHY